MLSNGSQDISGGFFVKSLKKFKLMALMKGVTENLKTETLLTFYSESE